MSQSLWILVVVPIGLGLLAFIEPCSMGSSMLFLKSVEGRPGAQRLGQAAVFTFVRAGAIGLLGAVAALVGAQFVAFQRTGGVMLALLYAGLGALYLAGKSGWLERTVGPRVSRLGPGRSAAALGLLFALNIPACATPLLAVLVGAAAAGTQGSVASGFVMLSLFGLAMSAPLVAALLFEPMRRAVDRCAALSVRMPAVIGAVLLVLGAWTFYMSVSIEDPVSAASER